MPCHSYQHPIRLAGFGAHFHGPVDSVPMPNKSSHPTRGSGEFIFGFHSPISLPQSDGLSVCFNTIWAGGFSTLNPPRHRHPHSAARLNVIFPHRWASAALDSAPPIARLNAPANKALQAFAASLCVIVVFFHFCVVAHARIIPGEFGFASYFFIKKGRRQNPRRSRRLWRSGSAAWMDR